MCLVASGTSLGSVVHPIMLNNLFSRVGFANGVRISAAFVSVLLLVACVLIRTRLEPPENPASYLSVGKGIVHDVPFCLMCVGYVSIPVSWLFFTSDPTNTVDCYALTPDSISRSFTCNWILSSMKIRRRSRSILCVIC